MTNNDKITQLIEEIKQLKINVSELKDEIKQLKSASIRKVPGVFEPGDTVVILTNGIIGKAGEHATVTRVGKKRVGLLVKGNQHTNRSPFNIKHHE